jgi:hypothetical protein
LFNFDRPSLAHKALHSLDPEHGIPYKKFRRFQYLWQEQVHREGLDELAHFWVEPASRSSFTLPWPTLEAFNARHLELYPEEILAWFESGDHPLRHPRLVAWRSASKWVALRRG